MLVLGGAGFIGRHACLALQQAGAEVVIGSRNPAAIESRLAPSLWPCERRQVQLEQLIKAATWEHVMDGIDRVLNCVGILRQRGAQTYQRVHHQAPAALSQFCAETSKRLVHVSALGLHDKAQSRFLTSKLAGERALKHNGGDWIIARPSLLDGEGGFGARWLRGVAQLPVFVAPADAKGLIAALKVTEVGEALATLTLASAAKLNLESSREFELGGPVEQNFRDYIRTLRSPQAQRAAICIPIPGFAARIGAHLCDVLHFSPFSFGHWELLRRNNVPRPNRMADLLGREPSPVVAPRT